MTDDSLVGIHSNRPEVRKKDLGGRAGGCSSVSQLLKVKLVVTLAI